MSAMQEDKQLHPRMFISVNRDEDGRRLEELFDDLDIPFFYQCRGKGTASSEMMDIFGLSGTTRLITVGFLPKARVGELFEAMTHRLSYRQRGSGIALSIPITGIQSGILQMLREDVAEAAEKHIKERIEKDMAEIEKKSEYTVIWVSVASGYSDDVVDASRAAGARGGTVFKGRRRHSERVSQHMGISTQDEQDFVMIVTPKEKKSEVMSAISNACGLRTPAHGVVLSLPVDEVIGLEE